MSWRQILYDQTGGTNDAITVQFLVVVRGAGENHTEAEDVNVEYLLLVKDILYS